MSGRRVRWPWFRCRRHFISHQPKVESLSVREGCSGHLHEQRSIHNNLIIRNLILLLPLLEDIPNKVSMLCLGIHPPDRLLSRVSQMHIPALSDHRRNAPQHKLLSPRSWACEAAGCLLECTSFDRFVDEDDPVCGFTAFAYGTNQFLFSSSCNRIARIEP